MEVHFEIDDQLLRELGKLAGEQDMPTDAAFCVAVADWIAQARREAIVRELFEASALQDE